MRITKSSSALNNSLYSSAVFAILISFLGKFTAIVSTIPNAVLGGVSLLLYGFIAVNGLKVLIRNQVNFEDPKNVIIASSMLVLGLGGAAIAIVNGDMSITLSGMSLASIVGIILNLVLPGELDENEEVDDIIAKKKYNVYRLKDEIKKELKQEIVEEVKNDLKKK